MFRPSLLSAFLFLAGGTLSAQPGANPLEVVLRVIEPSGIRRLEEPSTFGVPLPEGQIYDTDGLALLNEAGQPIPASFEVAQRWLSGSIQWLHVHTLLTVPADQGASLRLTRDSNKAGRSATPLPTLLVEKQGDRATIVTGPVKIVLSARTPGAIEAAYHSPSGRFESLEPLLKGNAGSRIQAGGRSRQSVLPGSGRLEILEQSAMRVVVLVAGQFAETGAAGAGPSLSYEARIIAYAGSPRVTMDYTIVNRTGRVAADKIDLDDLSLAYGVSLSKPIVTVGGVTSAITGTLESESSVFQDSADHYGIRINGRTVEEGPGKSVRAGSTGWLDLSDGSRGVAVGIRDFWQTWPKRIEAAPGKEDGSVVRLSLYPLEIGRVQELYIGQARSHRITFRFHGSGTEMADLGLEMAGINGPLRVVCDPEWYCRRSRPYGPIAAARSDFGPFVKAALHYEEIVEESMDRILAQLHEGRTSQGVTRDSYGWMNWGDVFFRAPGSQGRRFEDPDKNLSWSGNYYDYGFAMLFQFLRTGDLRYLETGLRAGAYTADVFIVHHHPDPTLIGACHYCPPRYHAATDDGEPYISRENNHAKVASVLARWQWLGDWWARQVALEAFNNALTLEGADLKGWEQCRGNGHRLRILWLAHHFTGERKYREKAQQLIDLGVEYALKNPEFDPGLRPSQRFMVGIALEGLILHYWDTRDPAILEAVKAVADRAYHQNRLERYTANMAMSFGFLWKETGDPTYLKALTEIILATEPTDQAKIFGQAFRSTPWALAYLEEAAAKGER